MKLIIGLGNPGKEYEKTRHNVGFMVLDTILERMSLDNLKWKRRTGAAVVEIPLLNVETSRWDVSDLEKRRPNGSSLQADKEKILLVAPQKFINLSGQVVSDLQKFYDVENQDLIVICDDLSLEFGQVRVRNSGSGGNHNGLKNIIDHLGENFKRIRIGIKNPFLKSSEEWPDFVLANFNQQEEKVLPQILDLVADFVLKWVSTGELEEKTIKIK